MPLHSHDGLVVSFRTMTHRPMTPDQFGEYDRVAREGNELVPLPWQKRMLDVALSLGLLLLLSPVIVVMILMEGLVRPAPGGPILLSEPRGSEGRVFRIPKLRIIRMEAYRRISSEQKYLHIKPMERVPENLTTVGRFLKKVYLDELRRSSTLAARALLR